MPVCTFFGHRDCPSSIKPKLRDAIVDLIETVPRRFAISYHVTEVAVIQPNDIDAVKIRSQKDMLTLITCHPYASGGRFRLAVYCER